MHVGICARVWQSPGGRLTIFLLMLRMFLTATNVSPCHCEEGRALLLLELTNVGTFLVSVLLDLGSLLLGSGRRAGGGRSGAVDHLGGLLLGSLGARAGRLGGRSGHFVELDDGDVVNASRRKQVRLGGQRESFGVGRGGSYDSWGRPCRVGVS